MKDSSKEKIEELEKLGVADHKWLLENKILLAWIPLDKLEEVACLECIARISAPTYSTKR